MTSAFPVGLVLSALIAGGVSGSAAVDVSVSSRATGDNIYEITASGSGIPDRDAVEGRMLVESAKLTLAKGGTWFAVAPMPGEGSGAHPSRPTPDFGAKYGTWHVQWSYRLEGQRWQRWRPEWAAPFWTDSIGSTPVAAFEASALVRIGSGPAPNEPEVFDAAQVVNDLG